MRGLARLVYRDIDVRVPAAAFADGPVLAVSNHFGGLSDGVLLIDASPRMPRVIARDLIWKVPVVGQLATAVGMIPVHRAVDGAGTSNDQAFASAYEALRNDDVVLIFPEGVTQDVPYMAEVHTGAARIALGARHGSQRIRVVPIGLHYENKAGFRSRALVNVGEPIDLDAWADSRPDDVAAGADDREAVDDLTALVDAQLRRAAPDFPDWPTADALELTAEVLLNDVDPAPAAGMQYGDRALLADRLNRLPEPRRSELITAGSEYDSALTQARTSDRAIARATSPAPRSWRWLGNAALILLLLPYALMGLVVAAFPLLVVFIVSRLPIAPAERATFVPAVALLTFLAEWALFRWQSLRDGGWEFGTLRRGAVPVPRRRHVLRARAGRTPAGAGGDGAVARTQPNSSNGRPSARRSPRERGRHCERRLGRDDHRGVDPAPRGVGRRHGGRHPTT